VAACEWLLASGLFCSHIICSLCGANLESQELQLTMLDGNRFFNQGTNFVAIAAQIGTGTSSLQSTFTDPVSVDVEGDVKTSATFVSPFFVASGYSEGSIQQTPMKLMWQQSRDRGVNINEFCYEIKVADGNDLSSMGFTDGSTTSNGVSMREVHPRSLGFLPLGEVRDESCGLWGEESV
jgi:hypothetical protein